MSMDSSYRGDCLGLMIYGQSHSETIGVYISGLPEEVTPDEEFVRKFMSRRAPGKNAWSTPRSENDEVHFDRQGRTLHAYIVNTNTKPGDYASIMNRPRPSHADYTARILYGDEASVSGGGIFSGRMTAPLCIAGAIALSELRARGVKVFAHLKSVAGISDETYFDFEPRDEQFMTRLSQCADKDFPAISDSAAEQMKNAIEKARMDMDSVGGVIECVIYGVPEGLGGPIFDGIEGKLAQILYAVPAVKGVEFGNGFAGSALRGSENNDAFFCDEDGVVRMRTNHSGGILGGISVGQAAPIVVSCAMKPTPSIGKEQDTVDISTRTNTKLSVQGRHDPCIAPRAVPVIEAACAVAIYDMILAKESKYEQS